MTRSLRAALAVAAASLSVASPAAAAEGCVTAASADRAALALYGAGTELVSRDTVAGLSTALVLEPRIAPGTRHRMIRSGAGWCDATTGFNDAFDGSPREAAAAYARLAAAPYFDGVTVKELRETAPGVFALKTHARTNGVEAAWVIAADALGVRSATWRATAFAVRPFRAELEGLTALPGLTESYDRVTASQLRPRTGLPTAESARSEASGPLLTYTSPDGFQIDISAGDTRVAPNLGMDTGVWQVDVLRATHAAVAHNYDEFHAWGLRRGWNPADKGYVYVNDALSLACFACVFIADEFQIHITSEVLTILEALGYSYREEDFDEAYANVIGHEMFHNFQNRYVKPGPIVSTSRKSVSTAYSEGTARFQETLHSYAEATHQPGSLFYANDANGCNGYAAEGADADEDMATGPFAGRAYDSCYFWGPWFAEQGAGDFLALVTTTMPAAASESNQHREGVAAVEQAAGEPFVAQQADFAASALTGSDRSWRALTDGEVFDWGPHLERWTPAALERGGSATATLSDGGLMARALPRSARVTLSAPEGAQLIVVRESGRRAKTSLVRSGSRVNGGQGTWVVVAWPKAGDAEVTLRASS